jgi:hypothetical protein
MDGWGCAASLEAEAVRNAGNGLLPTTSIVALATSLVPRASSTAVPSPIVLASAGWIASHAENRAPFH